MSQSSIRRTRNGPRRLGRALAALGAALGAVALLALGAEASSTTSLKVDRQDSQADTPVNPYSDTDLHVAVSAGSQAAHSYVHLAFDALPRGASISKLTLSLVQSASASGNVNASNAAIHACVLTQELPAAYDSTKPPAWDCKKADAIGKPDGNGGWTFDLQPLAYLWDQVGNTGAAIVPLVEPPPVGSQLGTTGTSWALAFDPAQSAATVEYTPAAATPSAQPTPVTVAAASSAPAPFPGPARVGLSAPLAAAPLAVSVPPSPPPAAAAPAASASPAAATPAPAPVAAAPAAEPAQDVSLSAGWVRVAIAIGLLAALLVAIGLLRQLVVSGGTLSWRTLAGSLGQARAQVATPVAVLVVGAVIAAGFAGRVPASSGASTASGGTALSGGQGVAGDAGAPPLATPPPLVSPGATPAPAAGPAGVAGGVGPAGSAPGSSASAAPSTGSSGGGATPRPATGPLPQGVTPTTIRVGFFDLTNANSLNQAAGVNGINNLGDTHAQINAVVDWVNKHGGVAGHQIEAVFVTWDESNTDPSYPVQECKAMTEDKKVFAVEDSTDSQDAMQCYVDHRTVVLSDGLNLVDENTMQSWSPYYWSTTMTSLDRQMAEELDGLASKGFFQPGDKIGFMYGDQASTQAVINRIVQPRLTKLGYNWNSVDKVGISATSGNPADTYAAIQNGVLKFKTDLVTKVFYVNDAGAALALYSMRYADSEQYRPRYGLSSQDGLDAIGYLTPSSQLQNAIAVGYLPWTDTSTANSEGFPGSPAEAQCFKIMNDHNIATPNPPGRDGEATVAMTGICDSLLLLDAGGQGLGQSFSPATFGAAVERLGSSYQAATGYAGSTYFGPRHHDALDSYRFVHFDPSCTNGYDGGTGKGTTGCWKYDDKTFYRSPEV